ncbi:MAG: hypothetical protein QW753_00625 [Thermofilum sp.]
MSKSGSSDLVELARLLAKLSRALGSVRGAAEEALLGELKRAAGEELARALYGFKPPRQPKPEELKAEIARLLGLNEVGDLAEELERALRGSESSRAERVRERPAGAAGES